MLESRFPAQNRPWSTGWSVPLLRQRGSIKILRSATVARSRGRPKPGAQSVVVGTGATHDQDGIRVGAFREQDAGGGEKRRCGGFA
jgi:hypothetical protein